MQAKWDFTDSAISNKWATPIQLYRKPRYIVPAVGTYTDGYPLVISKNKVRGRGKALQMKFASEGDKDFQLVGWTTTYMGNTSA